MAAFFNPAVEKSFVAVSRAAADEGPMAASACTDAPYCAAGTFRLVRQICAACRPMLVAVVQWNT